MEIFSASSIVNTTTTDQLLPTIVVGLPTFDNISSLSGLDVKVVERKDNTVTLQITEVYPVNNVPGNFRLTEQYQPINLPKNQSISDLDILGTTIVGGIFKNNPPSSSIISTVLFYLGSSSIAEKWLIGNYVITDT